MRPVLMIVANIFAYQTFQVPFIQDDHVVEEIPLAVTDPTLRNAILLWTSKAGSFGLDAKTLHRADHIAIELWAAIKDQVAGSRIAGKGLA
jgi:hypothetical protein